MKIQESTVELTASHEASRNRKLEISSEMGFRRLFDQLAVDSEDNRVLALQRVQKLLQSLVDAILAAIEGKKSGADFAACDAAASPAANSGSGSEISWNRLVKESVSESEKTTVCGLGKVTTSDGRTIDFNYALNMERHFTSEKSDEESGTLKLRDPLMLSFTGRACELTEECIAFDLDADGKAEQIPGMGDGSGFLVFDRNLNGKADDGTELFGVASGNGFADLAKLDSDRNGWIDEADPAYSQLSVWSNEGFSSLAARGVGALYTAAVDAPFSLKSASNQLLGQIQAAGLYLSETGEPGQLQHVDLAISALSSEQKHPEQGSALAS